MRLRDNIRIVLEIFLRDMKRLIVNPIAIIVVVGACLLPSLYAWYCIAANWDPYQNTGNIKIAVANLDEGADTEETGHIDIGKELIDKLHENDSIAWQFVDESQAMTGVESGEYYAAIIIPKDFSRDFTSIISGSFTRPQLDYYVNEKMSAVSPKITNSAAETIEKQLNESFVETVSSTVVDTLKDAGERVEDRADAADDTLLAGVARADKALDKTIEVLGSLDATFDSTDGAIDGAKSTLKTLKDSIPQVTAALEDAQNDLATMRDATNAYSTDISKNVTSAAGSLAGASTSIANSITNASATIGQAEGELNTAIGQARALLQNQQSLLASLHQYTQDQPDLDSAVTALENETTRLNQSLDTLQSLSDSMSTSLSDAVSLANSLNKSMQDAATGLNNASQQVTGTIVPNVTSSLDDFSAALGTLRGAVAALTPTIDQTDSILDQLTDTLHQARSEGEFTRDSLEKTKTRLNQAVTDVTALHDSASADELAKLLKMNAEDIGSFMSSPVELKTVEVYPVKNYGSGVAPFYTNLALWVVGFILMAIVRIRVDPTGLPKFTITQAYFGRWLTYVLLGFIAGAIVCAGDLVMGIQCENPVAFMGAGLLTVFVYVNVMYALAFAFKHIGKAFAVILLIMQIPGSSGMYPVEMMPPFFQAIHPLLPFTYSIDAMRQAIGGMYGMKYAVDLAQLFVFFPIMLFIGLFVGKHDFSLNVLFDNKLGQTDLWVNEKVNVDIAAQQTSNRLAIKTLIENPTARAQLAKRIERFHELYPKLLRIGWVLVFAQPVATFIVMVLVHADVNTKLILLAAMVVGIILVDAYLIVIEYIKNNLDERDRLSKLDKQSLLDSLVADPADSAKHTDAETPDASAMTDASDAAANLIPLPGPAEVQAEHDVENANEPDHGDVRECDGGPEPKAVPENEPGSDPEPGADPEPEPNKKPDAPKTGKHAKKPVRRRNRDRRARK